VAENAGVKPGPAGGEGTRCAECFTKHWPQRKLRGAA
jgi:hypothetical protein